MACQTISVDGVTAIVCDRSRPRVKRCACKRPAGLLCDWKTGVGKTCDRPICTTHAQEVAPDKHLCPEHQVSYQDWLEARKVPK